MPTVPNIPVLCLPDAQNACTIPVFPKLHAAAPSVLTFFALCQALIVTELGMVIDWHTRHSRGI